ncbi:MAG: peptidylprolyl isomerase [Nitrospinaceae bacterium]|nr:MAG: peptidylprolyl isomerase [Nitrospinaceae bacterium]
MFRYRFIKQWVVASSALCLIAGAAPQLFAHSGHKHDDKPPISLPEVTARVNDTDIKREVILRELKKTIRNYKDRGMTLKPDQLKTAAKKLIDDEIGRTLLLQRGEKIGVSVTPEMVKTKLNQIKGTFKSDAVFEHKLADQGMSLDQYQDELRTDLIMDQVIKKEVESKIKVNEKDLKDYYDQNINQYRTPEKARASVILIKLAPNSSSEKERNARKKIESILKQVEAGTDFSGLAKKFSQDSLAPKGGDLGFFAKKQMLPAFSERAFKLKVGEVSEIFKTQHGFHLLKVTDKKPGVERPFKKVKESIRQTLIERKSAQATQAYVQTLKKQADLKTYF